MSSPNDAKGSESAQADLCWFLQTELTCQELPGDRLVGLKDMPCHDKGSNAKLELWATDELHPGSGDVDHDEFDVCGPTCVHASFFIQGRLWKSTAGVSQL